MVNRRSMLGLIGAAVVTVAAPAHAQRAGRTVRIVGRIRMSGRGPVPAGILSIRLEEQGVMDKAARRIASTTVRSSGRARAVLFELSADRRQLERTHMPGFSVRLERRGRLIALNTTSQPYTGDRNVALEIEPILY